MTAPGDRVDQLFPFQAADELFVNTANLNDLCKAQIFSWHTLTLWL